MRAFRFDARRTKNRDARTDKMQHAKAAKEIANHSQKSDKLAEARARAFEKNFIGALRWRGNGRICWFECFDNKPIALDRS